MTRRIVASANPHFVSQAEAARRWKVSRKTITKLKRRGEIVIREADGLVDVAASEERLKSRPGTYSGRTKVKFGAQDAEAQNVTGLRPKGTKSSTGGNRNAGRGNTIHAIKEARGRGTHSIAAELIDAARRASPENHGSSSVAGACRETARSLEFTLPRFLALLGRLALAFELAQGVLAGCGNDRDAAEAASLMRAIGDCALPPWLAVTAQLREVAERIDRAEVVIQ
jgi:hypothetical protein